MSLKVLIVLGAILIAAAGGVAWFVSTRPEPPPPPIPELAKFVALEVRAVDAADRPEAGQRAAEQAVAVVAFMNAYYTHAFLRPDHWSPQPSASPDTMPASAVDPEAKLGTFFTAEASPTTPANTEALAIGDLATKLRRVNPSRQEITKISFHVADDLSTPFVIATVVFEATGLPRSRGDGSIAIVHTFTVWLASEAERFKIMAYSADLKADTLQAHAAFGFPAFEETRDR